ncbi:nucleotidyltransferase domain-containing protein [Hyphomicrobium sp. 99]|uniref:nucleotidyltransferase domain-containing protein n=1 Tax=Hyphomicrobium sp. 99 TaxID=1163419 RepID=UPI0012E08398|nr:hypothetical protein [Hyphomicrobium sp. 99]
MTFPAERVVPIIRFLEDSGIPVWLDGGWDIDALLQTQTRDHLDLDLIIPDPNLEAAELALGTLGFVRDERATWLPLRLVLRTPEGLEIDIHPVVFNSPFDADRMRANGVSADIQDIRALQNRFELAVPESYFDNPVAG